MEFRGNKEFQDWSVRVALQDWRMPHILEVFALGVSTSVLNPQLKFLKLKISNLFNTLSTSCHFRREPRVFSLLGFFQGVPSSQKGQACRHAPESLPSIIRTEKCGHIFDILSYFINITHLDIAGNRKVERFQS